MQRRLRSIRLLLATLFFVLAAVYLTMSSHVNSVAAMSEKVQIVPSALGVSMGVVAVWLVATFLFGRVYCSTVCPIGAVHDFVIPLRRWIRPLDRPFGYKSPTRVRWHILAIYLVALVAGLSAVPLWLEPWNIMRNICHSLNPSEAEALWLNLGISSSVGILSGVAGLLLIALCALFTGRGFCTSVCPVGSALALVARRPVWQIAIEPDKCINCMKCEEVCPAHCIKVAARDVDNSRCVRCFDCVEICPNEAVRFTSSRFRPASPLMRKVKES